MPGPADDEPRLGRIVFTDRVAELRHEHMFAYLASRALLGAQETPQGELLGRQSKRGQLRISRTSPKIKPEGGGILRLALSGSRRAERARGRKAEALQARLPTSIPGLRSTQTSSSSARSGRGPGLLSRTACWWP
jgi:hypothetical protein